jgi:aspartyl-tRNA(Asn)/glutamyl-tRNA(Gln) amidotransferase subunit A
VLCHDDPVLPSVNDLARSFLDAAATPTSAMDQVLDAVDRLDGELEAWRVVYADEARQGAAAATAQLDSGHRTGPFHGVPFALKDIVDVEGRSTTAGSAALADRVSPATATIARRLVAAGGVLIGKTKTVELALGGWGTNQHLGTPRNPWDPDTARAPGGSSSGSGVAVASGMAPCAIGTDTGGSVRLPAAFCGIVGLKTTEGLLPTDGIVPLSHTLDTPGPMARTVADAALMFDVLTGRHPADIDRDWQAQEGLYAPPPPDLRGVRLGAMADHERALVSAPMLVAYDAALDTLADLGAEITVVSMPLSYDELKALAFAIVTPEAWHHHGHLFGDPAAKLDEHVRARATGGQDVVATAYIAAVQARQLHRAALLSAMAGLDALVTPTTPDTAPALTALDENITPAQFTRAANYLAQAALSLPAGLAPSADDAAAQIPASIQFAGRGHDEATLLRIGATFEQARGPLPDPPISS